jgi:Skp family chaperone for outer membrane proteins
VIRLPLLLALFGCLCTFSVQAETSDPIIAVVDVQRIVHESSAGKSIQVQYDKQHQIFGEQVTKLENDLDAREQELTRQRTVLTPEAFDVQRQALETSSAESQEKLQEQSQANQTAFNDAFAELVNNIRSIVTSVAKEKGISVVLSQEQVLYIGEGAVDITDSVLSRLDAKLPSVDIKIPSASESAKPGLPAPVKK